MTSGSTPPKGARVFLDYDQAELDACYDQANWAPNAAHIHKRNDAASDAARRRMPSGVRFAYGPGPLEHLDLFRCARANAPVFVYVHGGGWKARSSAHDAYLAEAFVAAGAHAILVDFNGVDELAGRLPPMIDQVRRAVAWVFTNASRFGGDPTRIHIAGHSSGAHLTGCVLVTDWSTYGVPDDVLAGALVCSGMYELTPVARSARRLYVTFDDETIVALSSQRQIERIRTPVIVGYGTAESPECQRQARDFAAALTAAGKPARLLIGEGYNHFEIVETLGNPYGLLGHALLEQMRLTTGPG